jgi:F0F1-type ATP synthase assembly protein I
VATERSDSPNPPPPRKKPATIARQIADVMELPILLVASVAIGGGLGYLVDTRLHTSPLFALILGALGFAAGMRQLIVRLSKDTNDDGRR